MNREVKGDAACTFRTGIDLMLKFWESNGQLPVIGSKIESWLRQAGTFSEVNVHEVIHSFGSQVSPGKSHGTHAAPPQRCSCQN